VTDAAIVPRGTILSHGHAKLLPIPINPDGQSKLFHVEQFSTAQLARDLSLFIARKVKASRFRI
jgi:hypothetical protein